MPRFEISVSYSKIIEASDKDEAQRIIDEIASKSELDGEYGPFAYDGHFTEVEEVEE